MKVNIFEQNRLMIVGSSTAHFNRVTSSLNGVSISREFKTLKELRQTSGDAWYTCMKVGVCRNPYDLAVSLHFWYQQVMNPKSMTLTTSIRNPEWKALFNDVISSMTLMDYDDIIRYEELEDDLKRIQDIFGFHITKPLEIKNMTRPEETLDDYRSLYDSRSRATITRMSRKVLDEYDYSF